MHPGRQLLVANGFAARFRELEVPIVRAGFNPPLGTAAEHEAKQTEGKQ